ncbi:hypothetical protein BH10PSE17_BH10PSE17_18840 [soil metagenome]
MTTLSPITAFFHKTAAVEARRSRLPDSIVRLLDRPVDHYRQPAGADPSIEPLTHVAFVLDASGSMGRDKAETIDGFNAQVAAVREGAVAAGRTTFTDVHFGGDVRINGVATDIDSLKTLTPEGYQPHGNTPLYDALGATIAALLDTARIDDARTATLVTVFTDGMENSSFRFDLPTLRAVIERLEATGRWTFALVGPTGSVHQLAEALAVHLDNVEAYDPASVSEKVNAFDRTSMSKRAYMEARSAGATAARGLFK